MKKFFILNFLLLLITLTSISTYGMWVSRARSQTSSYMRPQFVPTAQQRAYAHNTQRPRYSTTQSSWERSWKSNNQQTQWQQPRHQGFQSANQGTQTLGEWFKSMWYGTTPETSQQNTQSNQTKQQAKNRIFYGYGAPGRTLKNFITLLPEETTLENWKEKFYEVTKVNHPDIVDRLANSGEISPAEGNARKASYLKVISAYNAWKQAVSEEQQRTKQRAAE